MTDTYAPSLKTYKNTVPCGGYKLTGGGQIGDSVIDLATISLGDKIVLNSELLTKSEDNLYHDIKLSINTYVSKAISDIFALKEMLRTNNNNADELKQQVASSLLAKGKVLNYKDYLNIFLHFFGLECDGMIFASDMISEAYCTGVNQLLTTINFSRLFSYVVVNLNILTDEGIKTTSLSNDSLLFYPNRIPTTGNYIYFGENGNVVSLAK